MEKKKILITLNIFLILLFLALVTYLAIIYAPGITKLISKREQFRELLASYHSVSILVYIFFQVLQVVIAVIPGEVVQLAGGYVYGTFFGTVYSLAGILLGAVTAFYIARLLGYSLIKKVMPGERLDKLRTMINSPKSEITIFLLFLIPGIPKDMLVYIAGLTPVKPGVFFIIFIIARFPGILGAAFIGAKVQEQNYLPVVIVSVIACILFVIGFLKKEVIINKLHQLRRPKAGE
ncbi:MAG: VTT domain-containing protein [Firmicutes bacterium]|nr:VTT domain-containing protein [Bacillota bacterium]